jgi:EF hand
VREIETGKSEGNEMKLKQLMLVALIAGIPTWSVLAQADSARPHRKGPPPGENGGPQGGAQDGPGSEGKPHRPPPPLIGALDANHDGTISADEIANAVNALKALDKNGDGQLTMDELRPQGPPPGHPQGEQGERPPQGRPPGAQQGDRPVANPDGNHPRPPIPPAFAALDTNGDGIISADEMANAAASLLKLDKNNDGQLTIDELRPEYRPPPGNNN